ncbi:MAG: hypothetical protein M1166_05650 [Candidatus Thermoplasmatota archaeon]|nr:hypothetical protein [Candidatus Thermoplasmatota archaeon]
MDKDGYGCRDDIADIYVSFPDGQTYPVYKTWIDLLCKQMAGEGYQNVEDVEEWIMNGCTLQDLSNYLGLIETPKERPLEVKVVWLGQEMMNFAKRVVKDKYRLNTRVKSEKYRKLPESQGHIRVKNEVVDYLKTIGIEAYPEVVFYENALSDFYDWQRKELRSKLDADGIFGYGNVGFGHYKQDFGQQLRVDVAGWIDDSYGKFEYPIVAVEVMKSSKLQEEIMGLNKIHGSSVVYAIVVDALGLMNGQINGIPIVSLDAFKNGIVKRIEMVKNAIKEGKRLNEIFDIGRKFNTGKLD